MKRSVHSHLFLFISLLISLLAFGLTACGDGGGQGGAGGKAPGSRHDTGSDKVSTSAALVTKISIGEGQIKTLANLIGGVASLENHMNDAYSQGPSHIVLVFNNLQDTSNTVLNLSTTSDPLTAKLVKTSTLSVPLGKITYGTDGQTFSTTPKDFSIPFPFLGVSASVPFKETKFEGTLSAVAKTGATLVGGKLSGKIDGAALKEGLKKMIKDCPAQCVSGGMALCSAHNKNKCTDASGDAAAVAKGKVCEKLYDLCSNTTLVMGIPVFLNASIPFTFHVTTSPVELSQ